MEAITEVQEVQSVDEVAQAQALIQAKENEKAQAFLNAYKQLCEEHGYQMSPIMTIKANIVVPDLEVVKF